MAQIHVGNTLLHKSLELTGRCKGASVYVKREDKNPFDTFKDRRCLALLEANDNANAVFVHITSGNSGYSMGRLAEEWNSKTGQHVQVVNIVDTRIPKAILKKLESCSIVHRMDLSKKLINDDMLRAIAVECLEETGRNIKEKDVINVESHGLGDGYRQIIREIATAGVKPTYIFCPVGGGELAAELAAQAAETWSGNVPKIIGVTIKQNILTKAKELLRNPGKSIADKLVSAYSKFKPLVKNLIKDGKLELRTATDGELAREYRWLNAHGISAEPSAAAAFCGAVKYDLQPTDTVVIINTGKGIYDQSAVDKVWTRRLMRALKYAATVAATCIAMAAAGWCWLANQERVVYNSLLTEASFYSGNRDNLLSDEVSLKLCWRVGRDTASYRHLSVWDLTPREIEYYVLSRRREAMNDVVGRQMMNELQAEWESGKFRCEALHPNIPFMYKWVVNTQRPRWDGPFFR